MDYISPATITHNDNEYLFKFPDSILHKLVVSYGDLTSYRTVSVYNRINIVVSCDLKIVIAYCGQSIAYHQVVNKMLSYFHIHCNKLFVERWDKTDVLIWNELFIIFWGNNALSGQSVVYFSYWYIIFKFTKYLWMHNCIAYHLPESEGFFGYSNKSNKNLAI